MSDQDPPHAAGLKPRPLLFGEVLYDWFPDGSRVLGGAPFNLGWHLQGFGLSPLLISAVGDDLAGAEIRQTMADWGMDTAGLQTTARPTGSVQVSLIGGEPGFEIIADRAWDHIDADAARALVAPLPVLMLYHGTLALRSAASRIALETLRDRLELPTLVDINLRPPWWQAGSVSESLTQATWAKLNHHELDLASAKERLPTARRSTMARNLRARHGLDLLVVTEGAQGAMFVTDAEVIHDQARQAAAVADTVGAGDAFTAVLVYGIISAWPLHLTLHRALDFAAEIVAQRGAVSHDPELYRRHRDAWNTG